ARRTSRAPGCGRGRAMARRPGCRRSSPVAKAPSRWAVSASRSPWPPFSAASPTPRPSPDMLKIRIIPCLDVKDGRVVKGVNFVDLKDAGDPVEAAAAYDAAGADELCFLDITASHENRDTIFSIVERTAERCFMPLTVGGGVRAVEEIRKLLHAGADKVSINTA